MAVGCPQGAKEELVGRRGVIMWHPLVVQGTSIERLWAYLGIVFHGVAMYTSSI